MLKLKNLLTRDELEFVKPDDNIKTAIYIMSSKDYSQIPVMNCNRSTNLKGVITWKSLAENTFYNQIDKKSDVMKVMSKTKHNPLDEESPIIEALMEIQKEDFVLVQDKSKEIVGILTSYDIGNAFADLAEPLMLLCVIETKLRKLINERFRDKTIKNAKDPDRKSDIEKVDDLTFGEIVGLLDNKDRWKCRLEEYNVPLRKFINDLKYVNKLRNDLFHFREELSVDKKNRKRLKNIINTLRDKFKIEDSY